jgi:hypothetical protein
MFLDSHINEGKENLNFSEFGTYSNENNESKLDRMIKQIQSDEAFRFLSYHTQNARLTKESKAILLTGWRKGQVFQ